MTAKMHIGDAVYDWDMDHMSVLEGKQIKEQTGMPVRTFLDALEVMDPDAIQAAAYLAMTRHGLKVRYSDLETIDIGTIRFEAGEPERDDELEKAAEKAADPTPPVVATELVAAMANGTGTTTSGSLPTG